jgi:hypothetical protein
MLKNNYSITFHRYSLGLLHTRILLLNPDRYKTAQEKLVLSILKPLLFRIAKKIETNTNEGTKMKFSQTEALALHVAYTTNMLHNMTPDFMQFITDIDITL